MLNKRILVLIFLLLFLPLVGCFPGPSNETPIITSVPITTATVGVAYTYDVNATDPDDDTLTYSLTVKPTGMIINSATGLIKWTPAVKGNYAVVVKVSDGSLNITQSFTIKVSVVEPELTGIVVVPKTMNLFVGEEGIVSVTAYYSDGSKTILDLDDCDYKSSNETVATVWFLGLVSAKAEGTATITVGYEGKFDTVAVTVNKPTPPPVNHPPIITSTPGDTAIVEAEYIYEVKAYDPDGDVLIYSLITKPVGMTIDVNIVSWTPTEEQIGVGNFTVKVSDGQFNVTQTFGIIVRELELEITGITVEPKEMTFFVGEADKSIISVTATYEFRGGYDILVPLGDCDYLTSNSKVATVEKDGDTVTVTAVAEGTADILVSYKGKTDTVAVTVGPVHNIDTDKYYYTITEAIEGALDDNTIEVGAGTYTEQVVIDKQLTLNGTNASESIIDGGNSTAVTISANNVIVDGFTLDGGITLDDRLNPISGGTISNNIITGADNPLDPPKAQNGIRVGFDSAYVGLGVDGITIENNIISNNREAGIEFSNAKEGGGDGIQRISNITISGNEIKDNGASGISTYGPGPNTLINNIISDNGGAGMNLRASNGDVVTGNTITKNTGPGITLRKATSATVENNSVSGHQEIEVNKEWKGSGIQILGSSENTIRLNEISGNNYGIFIRKKAGDSQLSGNSINFNNIYGNNTYGILNTLVDLFEEVDATNNWWGSEYGPKHNGFPAEGGDAVSDNVDYEHWLPSEY